ncbi:MAG: SDR family oxidoreductase [Deferrisomatales bacterium]
MKIDGARILITGGTRGLGRQFALDLAGLGARVGVCGTGPAGLEALEGEFARRGLDVWTCRADVASEAEVQGMFDGFIARHGGVDAVVNNAGLVRDALLVKRRDSTWCKFPLEHWQRVMDVNLTGAFLCGREAAYHLVRQGTPGVIVSISSVCRSGNLGQTNYAAAKAGLEAMTVVWSKELSRYGIRVAAIAPGYLCTEMTHGLREDLRRRIEAAIPAGRMGKTEEVSHALRFVLENEYVTGRVLEVDGGLRI